MTEEKPPVGAPEKSPCPHDRTGTCQEPVKQSDGTETMQIVRRHCLDCGELLIDAPSTSA